MRFSGAAHVVLAAQVVRVRPYVDLTAEEQRARRDAFGTKTFARVITLVAMVPAVAIVFVIDVRRSGWKAAFTNAGENVWEILRWSLTGRGEVGGEEW